MLICKNPGHLQIEPDQTVRKRAFTIEDRDALVTKTLKLLGHKQYDAALLEMVDSIESTLDTNLILRSGRVAPPISGPQPIGTESGLLGWFCLAVVAFLVIWLVMSVFRAFRGGGSMPGGGPGGMPGGGYGPGGYGPGYGGGGGFFNSLLGGMFGAAAGNWMYDSFFRSGGHGPSLGDASSQQGGFGSSDQDTLPADQAGAGVFGGDTDDGGGGDFGGDDSTGNGGGSYDDGGGGGFDDGGGGDFGGGADFGGGGDFGGDGS